MVPDLPKNGDAEARSRFQDARSKFLKDGANGEEFRQIAEDFPDDPIVPWAQLYAGVASVKERKFDEAARALGQVIQSERNEGLTARARLFLGITKNYLGDARGALELLHNADKAIENDAERTEYLAAIAYATAAGDRPLASLGVFDQLYGRVTPPERAVIVARVEEVVAAADPNTLRRMFDELDDRKGPSFAIATSRLALAAEQAGNAAEAKRFRELAEPVRIALGLPRAITSATPISGGATGTPGLVGAVMPFGGKANRIAESATAGLGLAAGVATGQGVAAIELRAADDPASTELAIESLATKANVVAVIVGATDGAVVDAAIARAEGLGVPLIDLHQQAEKRATGRYVFHLRHSAVARARVLARRALAAGVKELAILAPQSGYGRAVGKAFADEVAAAGGTIITTVDYPEETKSFKSFTDKLGSKWKGVFVADNSEHLELIAPALAASGHLPLPAGTPSKGIKGGRPVLLLSTAEGLEGRYIGSAGRHSIGALLAPGYYPDDQDPASKQFLDGFIAAYGRAPGVTEAYAYDAAQLAASAGGGGRAALAASLAGGQMAGLTGAIQFDPKDHQRSDPGLVYTVVDDNGALAIRIAR
jgi:ABC-type branched-subunit amino acid transport system substrate-binding protein